MTVSKPQGNVVNIWSGNATAGASKNTTTTGSTKKTQANSSAAKNAKSKGTSTPNKTSAKSQDAADKKYIEIEYNLLEGDISVLPLERTLKLSAGDNIALYSKEVGCLSGLYLVTSVTKTLSSDGIDVKLSVVRNGFTEKIFKEGVKNIPKKRVVTQ